MLCPRDRTELEQITQKGLSLERCPQCMGIWFDGSELDQLVRTHVKESVLRGKEVTTVDNNFPVLLASNMMAWVCPKDGATLERVAYANDRGTAIEHCDMCGGWWFDYDDVDRALRLHVPDQTIERVATSFLQEEIRQEKERERDKERLVEIMSMFNGVSSPYWIFFFIARVLKMYMEYKTNLDSHNSSRTNLSPTDSSYTQGGFVI